MNSAHVLTRAAHMSFGDEAEEVFEILQHDDVRIATSGEGPVLLETLRVFVTSAHPFSMNSSAVLSSSGEEVLVGLFQYLCFVCAHLIVFTQCNCGGRKADRAKESGGNMTLSSAIAHGLQNVANTSRISGTRSGGLTIILFKRLASTTSLSSPEVNVDSTTPSPS